MNPSSTTRRHLNNYSVLCSLPITACAVHFDAGDVYHYSYVTEASLNGANEQNPNGAYKSVGFRLSGDLKLSVVWKKSYDYLMKLEVRQG